MTEHGHLRRRKIALRDHRRLGRGKTTLREHGRLRLGTTTLGVLLLRPPPFEFASRRFLVLGPTPGSQHKPMSHPARW